MPNPLHLLHFRTARSGHRRRKRVPVPAAVPTDVIFLVMRRLRMSFIVVITTFSVCTVGMMFMPGTNAEGEPYRMTLFDAFYQMSITLTTVGYSEVPYAFSYPQRMWLTMSIYLLVVSWAYAIGVFFSLVQDTAFQDALAAQRFRRRVRRLVEPFFLIAGFGKAGRVVSTGLDDQHHRFVIVDKAEERIQAAAAEQFGADVPVLEGDCTAPALLGLAGLGHTDCAGVLALTDNDETNLAIVMSVSLLRPDLPVLACCSDRNIQASMDVFSPTAVINPNDRVGDYLALAIDRPITHQLLVWLMDNDQDRLPPIRRDLATGPWVVWAERVFGDEVASDLTGVGLVVELVDPSDEPDLEHAAGFIAGTANDTLNIAMAERARIANPDAFVVVRQRTLANKSLLTALQVDSVFVAADLVAREVLARVLTPVFWRFVEHAFERDEEWATALRDHLVERCGRHTPERDVIVLAKEETPAIAAWLEQGRTLRLGDLMRRPDDREEVLPLAALVLMRAGEPIFVPDLDMLLELGDEVLLVGEPEGLSHVAEICHYPSTVEYLATGHDVPSTWVWRQLSARRRARTA